VENAKKEQSRLGFALIPWPPMIIVWIDPAPRSIIVVRACIWGWKMHRGMPLPIIWVV